MDNDFNVDLAEIAATVRTHEVVIIRFITIGERLLLDFRSSDIDGPMVKLVEPVRSVQERYRRLRQLRPRFDSPSKIVSVFWPRFARSLEETGVWQEIAARVVDSGHPDAVRDAERELSAVLERERAHQRDAVAGSESFRTLWSASPAKR
ncbi:MAG TPA: hypothetical protein PJ994_08295 [Tepidiformaceae bacterium]|nr:hypothetical protein [Tepidiformaceae bacterium]HMO95241.1 hypothetical protein [Tepidiformaceae bacterium]